MKFIRKHIVNEGYFNAPDKARAARAKEKERSSAEIVVDTFRKQIQNIAPSKFDETISSNLVSKAFTTTTVFCAANGAKVKGIYYEFKGDTLICTCEITLSLNGIYVNSGSSELLICNPETVRMLENKISSEIQAPAKLKIKLSAGEEQNIYSPCVIFTPPKQLSDDRKIVLKRTNEEDLTEFCHLMNCIEGLDYWNHKLIIARDDPDSFLPSRLYTEEPLVHKFEYLILRGYDIPQLASLPDILSNEVTNEFFRKKFVYDGRTVKTPIPNYTGMVMFCMTYSARGLDDVIKAGNESAKIVKSYFSNYPNLYLTVKFMRSSTDFSPRLKNGKEIEEYKWNKTIKENIKETCNNVSLVLIYCGKYSIAQKIKMFNAEEEGQ